MKNLFFVLFILLVSKQALLLKTTQDNQDGISLTAYDVNSTRPVIDRTTGLNFSDLRPREGLSYDTSSSYSSSSSSSDNASSASSNSSSDSSNSSQEATYEASHSSDAGMKASQEIHQETSTTVEGCTMDALTYVPEKERITEYIEIDVPDTNPTPKVCKRRRPSPPQPEQVIYGPFYSQDIVTEKKGGSSEHHETEVGGLGFQERAERVFEEELEKREDETLSHLIEKQNETIDKTKKAKKKQQQLKKIVEIEYRKGKKANTKYINELQHELDKAVNRVEELQTEAVLANELIKEAVTEAHKEELRKEQADEFSKEIEKHLDQERVEENAALERLVELNKEEKSYNRRLDEINTANCSAAERRSELNELTHHVEESKKELVAELKIKLDNLSQEVQFENSTKARLCEIKKELITDKQNVEAISTEIRNSEERKVERTEEQSHYEERTSSEKSEITSEEHRREETESMGRAVEERLQQIQARKSLIEKLLFQETETVKRDVKKKKSGKRTLDELMTKKNAVSDYLKEMHVEVEEEHVKEEESHDAISDMLKQLEKGSFRSLDKSYEAKKEDSSHAKVDETSNIYSTTELEKSEEFQELKSHVSESTYEHKLEEAEREEKFEEVKQESINIAIAQVVAESVQEDKKAKCETLMETIHGEAAAAADRQ
jgi:hypothetical protein